MLKNEFEKEKLFLDLSPVADGLGMTVVDAYKNVKGPSETQVCITVMMKEGETGIDELTAFHRAVQLLLELEIGRDILSMEVSSPGLQRAFRDCHEFSVFSGKRCRVYSLSRSSWLEGTICSSTDNSVVLSDCIVVDSNESLESVKLDFTDVQKAKLEYKWNNKKSGDK